MAQAGEHRAHSLLRRPTAPRAPTLNSLASKLLPQERMSLSLGLYLQRDPPEGGTSTMPGKEAAHVWALRQDHKRPQLSCRLARQAGQQLSPLGERPSRRLQHLAVPV